MAVDASTTPWAIGLGAMRGTARELLDAAQACLDTRPEDALRLAQHARVMARNDNDPPMEAEALYRVASIVYQGSDPGDAFGLALDARDLAARCGASMVEVWSLNLLALLHYDTSNYSEALRFGLAALDLHRVHRTEDNEEAEGNLLNTVAIVHHSLGDLDRALVTYEAALAINRGGARPALQATTLTNMAEIRMEWGDLWIAIGVIDEALGLAREHAPDLVPGLLCRLADCYVRMGVHGPAGAHLAEARVLLAAVGKGVVEPGETAWTLARTEGRLSALRGDDDAAITRYLEALDVATRIAKRDAILGSHADLAAAYKRLGRFEAALQHQEARYQLRDELLGEEADLRARTLQTAHDTAAARQQAEILRLRTGELETLVRGRTIDLEEAQIGAFERLVQFAERRGAGRDGHPEGVAELAADIAEELHEPAAFRQMLATAARLHDIGLIGLPDRVLRHDEADLDADDIALLRTHAQLGADLLSGSVAGPLQLAAEVALGHHERWDGGGYPAGASGLDIPLCARIVAVADAYDAAFRGTSTRAALTEIDAARLVWAGSGSRFEPRIVEAFLRVLGRRNPELARTLALVR